MPALQDFLETLLQERAELATMSVETDNAATHFATSSGKDGLQTPPLSPSTQESRWGAIEVSSHSSSFSTSSSSSSRRSTYPCVMTTNTIPCKGSRWNMSMASAPLNSSTLNRRRSYIVSPPQRRMSFDDGPRMVSMVAPARR